MNSEEIVKLFEILRTEVTFKNIQNMYTPIKLLGGGAFSKVQNHKIKYFLGSISLKQV